MKCTIPGANLKVLGRAIQALSRIGDDLYVDPDVSAISFRSVNSSKSAYASFTFNKPFFAFYKYEPPQGLHESSKCKISMKSCLPVFRSPVMLDRKVENCLMRLEEDGCRLIFEMRFRNGFTKTHFLPVIECETLQVVCTKEDATNYLLAQAQLFTDAVQNFQNTQEEVTLSVTSMKASICSYTDGLSDPSKTKSTEIVLDPAEFNKYTVAKETSITFCLKEFRAIMSFAEATVSCVEAYFTTGGKPVIFGVKHENTYEANFVLSTLSPDSTKQNSSVQRMRERHSNIPSPQSAGTISKERRIPTPRTNSSQVLDTNTYPSCENILEDPLFNAGPCSPGTISKERRIAAPRTNSSQVLDTNTYPSCENILEDPLYDAGPCSPRDIERPLIRRGESPSLLSVSRINQRVENSANSLQQSNCDLANQSRKECTNNKRKIHDQDKIPSDNGSQRRRETPSPTLSSTMPRRSNNLSQPQTSENNSNPPHGFNIPLELMPNASTSLLVRESDMEDDDTVPSSPQPLQKRIHLTDIFDSTFDPNKIPGHDIILAGDSGDETT